MTIVTGRPDILNTPAQLAYPDRMRVFAIVAVVSIHASAVRVVWLPTIDTSAWWTAHLVDSLSRWAVPVFVMLSGALVLDPYRREPPWVFYRKRAGRVLLPLAFWAAFYFWWSAVFQGEPVDLSTIERSLWQGLTENHLYFLFIIIGLYAVTPPLGVAMRYTPAALHWVFSAAFFWWAASGGLFDHVPINGLTHFLPYVPYFVLGSLLRQPNITRVPHVLLAMAFTAATAVILVKTHQLVLQFGRADYRAFEFYDHFTPWVLAQAVCVFIGLQRTPRLLAAGPIANALKVVSPAVFGVYLIHFALLDVLHRLTVGLGEGLTPVAIVLEIAGALVSSTLLTLGWLRIPIARSLIGAGEPRVASTA